MSFELGQTSLGTLKLEPLDPMITETLLERDLLIVVPVFNIKDAWNAAKIASSKLKLRQAVLVSCVPCGDDYICVFKSKERPHAEFPVYKASSERESENMQ